LALLAAILLLLALGVILYKVYAATELKTSIFEIKSRADEIVQIAAAREQEIETLKHQIEKLKFELLIRDMAEASKKRKGGS
jgi:cell division protein FtsB